MQHRVFGLLPKANTFINKKLIPLRGDLSPLETLRVECRDVGPWRIFWDQWEK